MVEQTAETYDWPCHLRIAHGPHTVIEQTAPQDFEQYPCPGVAAHPDTMIGQRQIGRRVS